MKRILVLGAGKSSTSLIEYLIRNASAEDWHVDIADMNLGIAASKAGDGRFATAHQISGIEDELVLKLVRASDLVISLLPPPLHPAVAALCLQYGKHFLNASYLGPEIRAMEQDVQKRGLVFLCEMGLDPGIDHMSAMAMADEIRGKGGEIVLFRSHCGGLVAPESDDNPWHYKISWNPRNIIMAGKEGAHYREDGKDIHLAYASLFDPQRVVQIPGFGKYAWYPNRDSLSYMPTYGMKQVPTFVRTTLRHPDFCAGWKHIVQLKLTDETVYYDTDGMTVSAFFQIHFDRFGFTEWLQEMLSRRFNETRAYLEHLISLLEKNPGGASEGDQFLAVDPSGNLKGTSLASEKAVATEAMKQQMDEANLALEQLFFLGLDSPEMINQGRKTAAEILQWIMEKKLALAAGDRDMIVMLHEIGYRLDGVQRMMRSHLVVRGDDALHTAMAKTVGLPLGISAGLILQGKLRPGVQIPVSADIYQLVLPVLEREGIRFADIRE
jgi:saccharopine dehydrogenase-like NADP-dependent oxidoreductase